MVPNNITNFQVFNDDKHILDFMTSFDVFATQIIDEVEHEETNLDTEGFIKLFPRPFCGPIYVGCLCRMSSCPRHL